MISRDIFNDFKLRIEKDDLSMIDRAVVFYYLIRNSMFGAQESFLVQKTKTKPFSRNEFYFKQFYERFRNVIIENKSWEHILEVYDDDNTLFYLDPPYVLDTRNGELYRYELNNDDHEKLLSSVIKLKAKCIISGYAHSLYDYVLKDWNRITINVLVSIGRNTNTKVQDINREEVIWYNFNDLDLFNLI